MPIRIPNDLPAVKTLLNENIFVIIIHIYRQSGDVRWSLTKKTGKKYQNG